MLREDGSAVDPRAFQRALLADPARLASLEPHPDVLAVLRGDDMGALQQLLRQAMQVCEGAGKRVRACACAGSSAF